MKPTFKQYAVWEIDGDSGYWLLFDSLKDAAKEAGSEREIYEINCKLLGKFELKTSLVKAKANKKGLKANNE